MLVVRAAAELDIVHLRRASRRVRVHMMELEKRRLAARACAPNEHTSALVAQPYGPPDSGRDVTSRCKTFPRARPRRPHLGKPARSSWAINRPKDEGRTDVAIGRVCRARACAVAAVISLATASPEASNIPARVALGSMTRSALNLSLLLYVRPPGPTAIFRRQVRREQTGGGYVVAAIESPVSSG